MDPRDIKFKLAMEKKPLDPDDVDLYLDEEPDLAKADDQTESEARRRSREWEAGRVPLNPAEEPLDPDVPTLQDKFGKHGPL